MLNWEVKMKTGLYKLSGARTPEVSCKRKPLKSRDFEVAGSNREFKLVLQSTI